MIKGIANKGRGYFADSDVAPGGIICTDNDLLFIPRSSTSDCVSQWCYRWDDDTLALPLGPTALVNHATNPNARPIFTDRAVQLVAGRAIKGGEEITIQYGRNDKEQPEMDNFDDASLTEDTAPIYGYAVQPGLLGHDECDQMSKIMTKDLRYHGSEGTVHDAGEVDTGIRESNVSFIWPYRPSVLRPDECLFLQSIYLRMIGLANVVNGTKELGVEYETLANVPDEGLQFAEYKRGCFYRQHPDTGDGERSSRRYLSMTVLIDAASSGGDFTFRDREMTPGFAEQVAQRGTGIVFPSRAWHGISPVKKGRRRSLTQWFPPA